MESVLIDSDGHVSERDEVILQYLPEPFRGRRELLQRPIFPLGDHFHRMAEGLMDSRRGEDRGDEDRSALPVWQDLLNESLRRLLVNACYWALGMERRIDPRSNVQLVGTYDPLPFGFGKAAKGLKVSDLR